MPCSVFVICVFLEGHGRLLAIDYQRVFALGLEFRVVPVERPVAAATAFFALLLPCSYQCLAPMQVEYAIIREGRCMPRPRKCLYRLGQDWRQGNLRNVYISVSCNDSVRGSFLGSPFRPRKLGSGGKGSGLGHLSACVGIDLCVEDQDVDVFP